MLVGYVSDEMYVAIDDAQVEFTRGEVACEVRSSASGAVRAADIEPGEWDVVVTKAGYGRKKTAVVIEEGGNHQFRLLADRLLGYVWPKWVRSGERAELRVHSPGPYQASLWRYGMTKEFVADLGHFDSRMGGDRQLVPDGDFTMTGVRWNNHGFKNPVGDRYELTAPERSGLYYVHFKSKTGEFFSAPWIVAPKEPRAQIAVLASNLDWNAYNDFGGRSNYVAAGRLPETPVVNVRQDSAYFADTGARFWDRETFDPLSLDRPEPVNVVDEGEEITHPMERIGSEHVAPCTWRLVGWLEREGFAYDFYAETQLHAGQCDLSSYKVLVLDQHPEYWTRDMYFSVKKWVYESGGKLIYLGGNGLSCEVELDDSLGVRHYNGDFSEWVVRRSFEGGPNSILPDRFGARVEPESNLLGVSTSLTGMGTGAPYRTLEPDHWVFEGTGLVKDDLFGPVTLSVRCPGGASGHETDKRDEHSPKDTILLAKGTNAYGGGSEMVCFDTPSGGSVFSTGSINFIASMLIDEQVSRVARNVLRRFAN